MDLWPHCGICSGKSDFSNATYDWTEEWLRYFDAFLKEKDIDSLVQASDLLLHHGGRSW